MRSALVGGVTSGLVGCNGLDGKRIVGRGSVLGGRARCTTFLLPKSGAGSRLRGTISVHVDGKSVAASFAYTIR